MVLFFSFPPSFVAKMKGDVFKGSLPQAIQWGVEHEDEAVKAYEEAGGIVIYLT